MERYVTSVLSHSGGLVSVPVSRYVCSLLTFEHFQLLRKYMANANNIGHMFIGYQGNIIVVN